MNAKTTVAAGAVLLIVGVLLAAWLWEAVLTVFWGSIALLVLTFAVLLLGMGYVQVKEDRATAAKEREEAARKQAMTVQA